METAVILATGVPRAEFWTQPLADANPNIWNSIQRWHALQCAQLFLINGFKDSIRAEVIKAVGMDSIEDIMGMARHAETSEISKGVQPSAKVAEVQHPTDEVFKIEAPAPVAAVAKPKSKGKGKGKGKGKSGSSGAGGANGASGDNGPAPTGIHQYFVCDGGHFQAKCPEVLSGRKRPKTFETYAREKGMWNNQASGSAGGSAPGALAAQVQALQAQVNAQAQGQQPQQHQGMAQVEAAHMHEYMANVANFYKDQQQDFLESPGKKHQLLRDCLNSELRGITNCKTNMSRPMSSANCDPINVTSLNDPVYGGKRPYVCAQLPGKDFKALYDTGASISIVKTSAWQKMKHRPPPCCRVVFQPHQPRELG
jgi:hypothetical protein